VKQRTDQTPIQAMTILRTACLTALLAVPLAACSDRADDSGNAQVDAQQAARDKEVERRTGKEQPPLPDNEIEKTADSYGAPRESWTAGATARDAEFKDSAKTDARALDELTEALAARDDSDMIEVDVQDGVAHLEGEVESALDRREIEALAMAVEEIVAVRNDLEVGRNSD
jgi:hypothetical protein